MGRIPDTPPVIPPLDQSLLADRPLWSVMIPVFNCADYLQEALQSVLQQAGSLQHMQIEVVDDTSTDADIAELVSRTGKGRVGYYRQKENVGSLRNFETCLLRAKGKFIHLLHGDDRVLPGFYLKMEQLFDQYPDAGAAFCRYNNIEGDGHLLYPSELEMPVSGLLDNWLMRIAKRQRIQTPAIAVKRSVYEKLGSFYAVHYGEDWEMWIRIAAHYPFAYCPDILAAYRRHDRSISGQYFRTAQNIRDLKKVMQLTEKYIPLSQRKSAGEEAKKFYAKYAISTARMVWHKYKDPSAVRSQVKEALSMHNDAGITWQIMKLKIKMWLNIR